ncbi:NAD-specific glutamate dehydrogenase [Pedobacter cryoconitis]|uniref:gluconate 2-dehydrogenase subunit 3 family protein n=1 Tax=Pedobacter cryoconitis TaxID=188932 RepID=UPI001618A9EE|nr:gluconate 2-dehydrogenase subunit 3 family protein [Pedobacter cryoconitis]MBB6270658.1 NAD-specific glutamate dehydrogenase [Pedobacter cryoconitis]
MERRELLKMIALLTGGVMIGGNALLTGCSPENGKMKSKLVFSPQDIDFLDEVADTILPATKSPGAKAAKVGSWMTVMVNDCYEEKDQKIFKEGIDQLNQACEKMYGTAFMKASTVQRLSLLTAMDKEAKEYQSKKNRDALPAHYFTMMKQLTLLGYFTSEIGCTKALRYIAVPGRFQGTVPYKKGDKAWA